MMFNFILLVQVYWLGPMLGVVTALIAYYLLSWQKHVIKKKEKEEYSLKMLPRLTLGKSHVNT